MLLLTAIQAAILTASPQTGVAPRLLNPDKVLGVEDYPSRSLQDNEAGVVSVLLHVAESGKVTSCLVTESSGFAGLDKTTCSVIRMRARFEPAKLASGAATSGEFRMAFSWGVGEQMPSVTKDVTLQVSKVPSDYRAPAKTRLLLDGTGHVTKCEVTSSSGSAAADRAVCAYLQQFTVSSPKSGSEEVPATAVRYLTASLSDQTTGGRQSSN
jgi:TonB family protein